jgi:hypothetical protein
MTTTLNASTAGAGGFIATSDNSGVLALQTAGTTAITVDASQRVAFVAGTAALPAITTTGDTNTGIFFPAADTIAFSEGGAESMRIDSSGNVGIGVTPPAWDGSFKALDVGSVTSLWTIGSGNGTSYYTNNLYYNGSARIYKTTGNASEYTQGGGSHRWYIAASGTAGNSVSLTEAMVIDSSGYLKCLGVYNQTNPNAANVFVGSAGDLYRSTSSLKYKKNIENSVHGLTDLLNLRSVTYQSNNPDNGEQVFGGFIAEEVDALGLTEFVQYAEDGSPDALAYGNMVALCVKSIQELKAINDTQAETINALTARIVALEEK